MSKSPSHDSIPTAGGFHISAEDRVKFAASRPERRKAAKAARESSRRPKPAPVPPLPHTLSWVHDTFMEIDVPRTVFRLTARGKWMDSHDGEGDEPRAPQCRKTQIYVHAAWASEEVPGAPDKTRVAVVVRQWENPTVSKRFAKAARKMLERGKYVTVETPKDIDTFMTAVVQAGKPSDTLRRLMLLDVGGGVKE